MRSGPDQRVHSLVMTIWWCLVVACVFHWVMNIFGRGFPWNTFLFQPWDRLNDWHNTVAAAATLDPYHAPRAALSVYFPSTYVLLLVPAQFGWLGSTVVYLTISIGLLSLGIAATVRGGERSATFAPTRQRREFTALLVACLLSYPMLFALDRGNLDAWISSLCLLFVGTLRTRLAPLGFAALSLAIALKGFPAAFLGLAIVDRRYRATFLCLVAAVAANLASLALLEGGFWRNLNGLVENLRWFREYYVLGPHSLFASSDPYNGLRLIWLLVNPGASEAALREWSEWLLSFYAPMAFGFAVCGAIFVLVVPAAAWRRIVAICLVILLFPNVANDYKLTMLLPGVLALTLSGDVSRRASISFVLLCLLLVPKSYWFFDGRGVTMLVNPFLLVALASTVIGDRRAWRAGWRLVRYRLISHSAAGGRDSAV